MKFRKPVVPGDTLVMEVELIKFMATFGIAKLKGKAYVDGEVAVEIKVRRQRREGWRAGGREFGFACVLFESVILILMFVCVYACVSLSSAPFYCYYSDAPSFKTSQEMTFALSK